jgi:hypothetical protein
VLYVYAAKFGVIKKFENYLDFGGNFAVKGSEAIMAPDSSERETNGGSPPPIDHPCHGMTCMVLMFILCVSSQPDKTDGSIGVVVIVS